MRVFGGGRFLGGGLIVVRFGCYRLALGALRELLGEHFCLRRCGGRRDLELLGGEVHRIPVIRGDTLEDHVQLGGRNADGFGYLQGKPFAGSRREQLLVQRLEIVRVTRIHRDHSSGELFEVGSQRRCAVTGRGRRVVGGGLPGGRVVGGDGDAISTGQRHRLGEAVLCDGTFEVALGDLDGLGQIEHRLGRVVHLALIDRLETQEHLVRDRGERLALGHLGEPRFKTGTNPDDHFRIGDIGDLHPPSEAFDGLQH